MRFPRVPAVRWGRSLGGRLFGPPEGPESLHESFDHDRPGFAFRLRDGRPVFLTPVLPEDRGRLEAGFEQLSERSRVFRFFRQRDSLTESEIRQLTEVDQVDHVAWCALDLPDPPFDGLGSGRMIREKSDPNSAEVAVTVIDPAQRHGLGTVLLGVLVLRARMLGIERLRAYVLPGNTTVVQWLTNLGWRVVREDAAIEFETDVDGDGDGDGDPIRPPVSPTQERFRRLLGELEGPLLSCLDEGEDRAVAEEPSPSGRTPRGDADEAG